MKKYFSIFALAVAALATSLNLTSCGSDGDDTDPVTPAEQTYMYTGSVTFSVKQGGTAIEYRNIFIQYLKDNVGDLCEFGGGSSALSPIYLSVKKSDADAFDKKLKDLQNNDASTLDKLFYNDGNTQSATATIDYNGSNKYKYTYTQEAYSDFAGTYTATVEAGTYTLDVTSTKFTGSDTHYVATLTLADGTKVDGWVYPSGSHLTFNSKDKAEGTESYVYHMLSTYVGETTEKLNVQSLQKYVDGNYQTLLENVTFTKK